MWVGVGGLPTHLAAGGEVHPVQHGLGTERGPGLGLPNLQLGGEACTPKGTRTKPPSALQVRVCVWGGGAETHGLKSPPHFPHTQRSAQSSCRPHIPSSTDPRML